MMRGKFKKFFGKIPKRGVPFKTIKKKKTVGALKKFAKTVK